MNPDTVTFLVKRGAALLNGRFDRLDEHSTQVTFQSGVDWLDWAGVIRSISVVATAWLGMVGAFLQFVARKGIGGPMLLGAGALLLILVTSVRGAIKGRNMLAREIEMLLTDPIPDVPDLSALDDEADGELVEGPPLPAEGAQDKAHPLESLLAPKRRD